MFSKAGRHPWEQFREVVVGLWSQSFLIMTNSSSYYVITGDDTKTQSFLSILARIPAIMQVFGSIVFLISSLSYPLLSCLYYILSHFFFIISFLISSRTLIFSIMWMSIPSNPGYVSPRIPDITTFRPLNPLQ